MSTISTAVGLERKARVSGYKIKKGFFSNKTNNLPQIIAVFGEANTSNQAGLGVTPVEVTSANQAGDLFGYGSPIHQIMRILRPISGDGVGGIPTVVFPQVTDEYATPATVEFTVTGTATENATHSLVINGRNSVDFIGYDYSVVKGDTAAQIAQKIADSVNGNLNSPVTATVLSNVVTFTTKWKGATSSQIKVEFDTRGKDVGLTYAQTDYSNGSGDVNLASSFALFGDTWYTSIINPYLNKLDQFEAFNGFPDDNTPTGRYNGLIFKPFMAFTGVLSVDVGVLIDISNDKARRNQCTNVICPAPNSSAFSWEVAANYVALFARIMQDTPHLDVNNKSLPDCPIPTDGLIGDMSDYNNRDLLVKKGCSTVILENGAYKIQDLVTTYQANGEDPLQYNYARNLNLDWNVSDSYRILENIRLKDKTLVGDNQIVGVSNTIKPVEWKAVCFDLFDDLAQKALINDPQFSKDSLIVQISKTNTNRFETFFRYKRTGIARIESTDAEAGF